MGTIFLDEVDGAGSGSPLLERAVTTEFEIPEEFADPRTVEVVKLILAEIQNRTQLLMRVISERVQLSEHQTPKWLRLLNQSGYVETGKTRQGLQTIRLLVATGRVPA